MRAPILKRPFWRGLVMCITWAEMARIARIVGYEPTPAQLTIHQNRCRFRAAICGRRFGKSTAAAFEAVVVAVCGGWVWCVAPTYELSGVVFEEALRMIMTSDLKGMVVSYNLARGQKEILLATGGRITSKSSDHAMSLVARGLDLIIFDEPADESDETIQQQRLRPALSDRIGAEFLIGTPGGEDDWVARFYYNGQDSSKPNWMSWRFPSTAGFVTAEELEVVRAEGIPEPIFRQQYLAEFLSGVGAVFRGFRQIATLDPDSDLAGPHVLGIDLARDVDYTTVFVLNSRSGDVIHVERWSRIDWEVQEEKIVDIANRYRCVAGVVDATGLGSRVFDILQRRLSSVGVQLDGYIFTLMTKSALMNQLAVAIEQESIHILSDEHEIGRLTIGELSAYRYEKTAAGNLKMGAPPGRHDDLVVGLALAVEAMRRFSGIPAKAKAVGHREIHRLSGTFGRSSHGVAKRPRPKFSQK